MSKKKGNSIWNLKSYIRKNRFTLILLLILFVIHIFFRFYQLEERAQFTWDQVDNAWHAKNLIINHVYPLTGMPAKQSSSISIGPLYYYFVTFFYFITNLDPIASPIIAGLTSIFSFITIYFVSLKLFNKYIALIALGINTFSFYLILQDRIQWPVNFIAPIGLFVFYSLYQIIRGRNKFFLLLLMLFGISFHIHFTFVFYIAISILLIPFFRITRAALLYLSVGLIVLFGLTVPFLLFSQQSSAGFNFMNFIKNNSVGFHFRRFLQVADTAFLEPVLFSGSKITGIIKFFLVPAFIVLYLLFEGRAKPLSNNIKEAFKGKKKYALALFQGTFCQNKKDRLAFLYLVSIWFLLPWVALTMFQGELTPYYFALTRYVSICLVAYIIYTCVTWKKIIFVPLIFIVGSLFFVGNTIQFLQYKTEGLKDLKQQAYDDFKHSRGNIFTYGAAKTYLYYFYEYRAYGKK